MECCHPIHQRFESMPTGPRPEASSFGEKLSYLFAPEASNLEHPPPDTGRPAWLGPVKALLWTGVSITAGMVLAMLFS